MYGVDPGQARVSAHKDRIVLENNMFAAGWSLMQGEVVGSQLDAHPVEKSIPLSRDLFILKFRDGRILRALESVLAGHCSCISSVGAGRQRHASYEIDADDDHQNSIVGVVLLSRKRNSAGNPGICL